MKQTHPVIALVLAYLVFAATIGWSRQALALCPDPPEDRSRITSQGNQDNCGDTTWELVADFAGTEFDEGSYEGDGVCTGGYINCTCGNVPTSYKTPTEAFQYDEFDEGENLYEYEWWWNITYYLARNFNSCVSGACQSTGYLSENDPTAVAYNQGYDIEDEECYD